MNSLLKRVLPPVAIDLARAIRSRDERRDVLHEYARRRVAEPSLPEGPVRRVIVLCYGNICRSPFAGLDLARRNPALDVRTAGLFAREGKPAEAGAIRIAAKHGIDLEPHAAHLLNEDDVAWADLLLGMQGRHLGTIEDRWPSAKEKSRLLGDFLAKAPYAIEDPWGHPDAKFESVFEQIIEANTRLCQRLEEQRA